MWIWSPAAQQPYSSYYKYHWPSVFVFLSLYTHSYIFALPGNHVWLSFQQCYRTPLNVFKWKSHKAPSQISAVFQKILRGKKFLVDCFWGTKLIMDNVINHKRRSSTLVFTFTLFTVPETALVHWQSVSISYWKPQGLYSSHNVMQKFLQQCCWKMSIFMFSTFSFLTDNVLQYHFCTDFQHVHTVNMI
jgi:hypothetical protein